MVINVSECYKTFDTKHNLEKIDIKSSSESIKLIRIKGLIEIILVFQVFLLL